MYESLLADAAEKMERAVEAVDRDLKTLRTGRATTAVLDGIKAVAYGVETPLNQLATISTPDAATILVQPWDQGNVAPIEKAIRAANIGLTPNNDGKVVRLTVPTLTEDTRKDIVKQAHAMAEHGRVAVRNIRRHVNDEIKKHEKDHEIGEDDKKRLLDRVQKTTDDHIKMIDAHLQAKEREIMKV